MPAMMTQPHPGPPFRASRSLPPDSRSRPKIEKKPFQIPILQKIGKAGTRLCTPARHVMSI